MLKKPTQHKYSEVVLFPALVEQLNSPKLNALMKTMQNNDIDVAIFESGVKVGMQSPININDFNTEEEIMTYMEEVLPGTTQELSYESYVIQQPVPDKLRDSKGIYGTQARAHLISNITKGMEFEIAGNKFNGEELKRLYHDIISENLIEG